MYMQFVLVFCTDVPTVLSDHTTHSPVQWINIQTSRLGLTSHNGCNCSHPTGGQWYRINGPISVVRKILKTKKNYALSFLSIFKRAKSKVHVHGKTLKIMIPRVHALLVAAMVTCHQTSRWSYPSSQMPCPKHEPLTPAAPYHPVHCVVCSARLSRGWKSSCPHRTLRCSGGHSPWHTLALRWRKGIIITIVSRWAANYLEKVINRDRNSCNTTNEVNGWWMVMNVQYAM